MRWIALPTRPCSPASRPRTVHGRANTAEILAFIAVADERKLYLPAAYPSMHQYCMGELHMSEDETARRIQAARAVRKFPAIFDAVADGRLHLSGVGLLAPHLTPETVDGVVAAATHRSCAVIRLLIAERFPQPDLVTTVQAIAPADSTGQHATQHVESPGSRAKVAPLSQDRFAWQVTVPWSTNDKLSYAQELLGHALPSGDIAQVLDRALDALIARLEQRKFAAAARSGPRHRAAGARTISADVRREVVRRDGGQCTFVSARGHRCPSRTRLEFDHVEAAARGGDASVQNLRLLCRAHNQHAAELTFGKGFMREKQEQARRRAARQREEEKAREGAQARERAAAARAQEILPWLRELKCRPDEARRAAALAVEALPDAPLAQQVHCALKQMAPAGARRGLHVASARA